MKYCIGVDLGGTNIAVGLVDLDKKEILNKTTRKTNAPRSCEAISTDIAEMCRELCRCARVDMKDIAWIGIATPGVVKSGVVVAATNLGWNNVNFAEIAERLTGRPIFVANDANAAAYAEAVWGAGMGESSLIAITLGTGVGGGIVIDGKIWEGINGFAAELGHMVIESEGRQCSCGQRGCLEAYCSATALVNETRRVMKQYPDSAMWRISAANGDKVSGVTAFKAQREGDAAAARVVNDYIDYLALGVANVINIFQPAVVCIGGGISGEGENLMQPLRERIKRISFGTEASSTRLEAARFRNDAGIIGAALLGLMKENNN